MTNALSPNVIGPDELLLRRVLPSWHPEVQNIDAAAPLWTDFRPTRHDQDGLSITRRVFVKDLAAEARSEGSGKPRALAQFRVTDVVELGLRVIPKPIEQKPGHALIPELNYVDYERGQTPKRKIMEWAMALATRATLIHEPPRE